MRNLYGTKGYEVQRVKDSRDMKGRYMLFEELMRDEFKAGKEEGMLEGVVLTIKRILSSKGDVSISLYYKMTSIKDMNTLEELSIKAFQVSSIEEFEAEVDHYIQ